MHRITGVRVGNADRAVAELTRFYGGESRLVIAFRHPTTDDPPVLAKAFAHDVFAAARTAGRALPLRPHLYFVYDRAVLHGLARVMTWLFPRLGNTPIIRAKADRDGLGMVRRVIASGAHPVAIAPEGGANEKSWKIGTIEDGLTQLVFWVQDEMSRAGRRMPVVVLPTGIRYLHQADPRHLDELLDEIEAATRSNGESEPAATRSAPDRRLEDIEDPALRARYARFLEVHGKLIATLEDFYRRTCGRKAGDGADRAGAIAALALSLAEERLAIRPGKTDFERLHRVAHVAGDRMFCEPGDGPARDGLAGLAAREAGTALVHMRIAQALKEIDFEYLFARPDFDRLAELLNLTWDAMAWAAGIDAGQRRKIPKEALVTFGAPVVIEPPETGGDWKVRRGQFEQAQRAIEDGLRAVTTAEAR
jgi:hypothetical protein